jgi:hypothetical protein
MTIVARFCFGTKKMWEAPERVINERETREMRVKAATIKEEIINFASLSFSKEIAGVD